MKRNLLLKYLKSHGCVLAREGKRHSIYINQSTQATAAIPRHSEIKDLLAKGICEELGVPKVGSN